MRRGPDLPSVQDRSRCVGVSWLGRRFDRSFPLHQSKSAVAGRARQLRGVTVFACEFLYSMGPCEESSLGRCWDDAS